MQGHGERGADGDDEQAVVAHAQHPGTVTEFGAALEPFGQLHDLLGGADKVVHAGHGHEGQADGEQHLVQVGLVVQRAVERALQHTTQKACAYKGCRQAPEKWDTQALHQQHRDVAAHHGKGTVREVDEVHQPHRHRQAHGQDEQQHAVGNAVKKYGQHSSPIAGNFRPGPLFWATKKRGTGHRFFACLVATARVCGQVPG